MGKKIKEQTCIWSEVARDGRAWTEHLLPVQQHPCRQDSCNSTSSAIPTLQLSKQVPTLNTVVPMVMNAIMSFVNAVLHRSEILRFYFREWDSWKKFPMKIPVMITWFHLEKNDRHTNLLSIGWLSIKRKCVHKESNCSCCEKRTVGFFLKESITLTISYTPRIAFWKTKRRVEITMDSIIPLYSCHEESRRNSQDSSLSCIFLSQDFSERTDGGL